VADPEPAVQYVAFSQDDHIMVTGDADGNTNIGKLSEAEPMCRRPDARWISAAW
jgi:hypothetical protein